MFYMREERGGEGEEWGEGREERGGRRGEGGEGRGGGS